MREALFSPVQIECILLGRTKGNKIGKVANKERIWNTQSCQEMPDKRECCDEERKNEEKLSLHMENATC